MGNDAELEKSIAQAETAIATAYKEVAQSVGSLRRGLESSSAASFLQQSIVGDESPPSYPTINAYLTQPLSPVQKKWAAANDAELKEVIENAEKVIEAQHKEVAKTVAGLHRGTQASSAASFMQQSMVVDESPP